MANWDWQVFCKNTVDGEVVPRCFGEGGDITYLDWLLSIPWGKTKQKPIDLNKAEDILEEDHYGLEKVKERILEYLAVQQRVDKVKAPILCLVGPPGVGKTTLAQALAALQASATSRLHPAL